LKHLLAISFLVLSCAVTLGQEWLPATLNFERDTSKNQLYLQGQFNLNSNSWNHALMKGIAYGEFLTDEIVDKASSRSRAQNRLGLSTMAEFGLESELSEELRVYLGLADRSLGHAVLSTDLNQFLLRGNSQFAGDTIYADQSSLSFTRFQEFKIGVFREKAGFTMAVFASLLNGELQQSYRIKTGRLYTDPVGASMSYDLDIERYQNDTLQQGFLAPNGIGMNFGFFLQKKNSNSKWTIGVQDLGWINWKDSSFVSRYVGADVWEPTLVRVGQSSGIQVNLQDSIRRFETVGQGSYNSLLPTQLFAAIEWTVAKSQHQVFANWRLSQYYLPWLQYRYQFRVHKNIAAYAQIGSGGIGNLFSGLGARVFSSRIQADIALTNVEGLLLPKSTSGLGAAIQLKYRL